MSQIALYLGEVDDVTCYFVVAACSRHTIFFTSFFPLISAVYLDSISPTRLPHGVVFFLNELLFGSHFVYLEFYRFSSMFASAKRSLIFKKIQFVLYLQMDYQTDQIYNFNFLVKYK